MATEVVISEEAARGCGHRKPAKDGVGVYLVGPSDGAPCGRLPFELHACPTCGGGFKPARGWGWITPRDLFGQIREIVRMQVQPAEVMSEARRLCTYAMVTRECDSCPIGLGVPEGRHGLIWVGEGHYGTPAEFMAEARRMGVSRKIKAGPKGLELGKTIVYLAHRHTPLKEIDVETGEAKRGPAIFSVFK